jgi:hypothetical protein
VLDVPDVLALDVLALAVRAPDALVPDAFAPDALDLDALVLDVLVLDVRELGVLALEALAAEVLAPDAFVPEVLARAVPAPDVLAPELLVRAAVPRDAVLTLVALPASAIPSHPPAHVPERVIRLSPRCFRETVPPSVTPQIQTDLFPGHGGAMGSESTPERSVPPVLHRRLRSCDSLSPISGRLRQCGADSPGVRIRTAR